MPRAGRSTPTRGDEGAPSPGGADRRAIGFRRLVHLVALTVVFGVTLASGNIVGRVPSLGGAPPTAPVLFASLAGFVVATVIVGWGATRLSAAGARG